MTPITFFVPGVPKAQPRPRAFARKFGSKFSARVYDPGTAEGWKSAIAVAAKPFLPTEPLAGPLRVDVTFIFPRPKSHFRSTGELKQTAPDWHTSRGDRDNLDKAVLDCLTQLGMWKDDGQVCSGTIRKHYALSRFTLSGASVTISAAGQRAQARNTQLSDA